jgi:hypothetical protein
MTVNKNPMSKKLRGQMLLIAGIICVVLGILGIFIPVLPTTPFLLLAAACFMRSSGRFHRWLLNNRILGSYIRNYTEGRGMPVRNKVFTIALLWLGIGVSAYLIRDKPVIVIILAITAAAVTWHIVHIRAKRHD